MRPLGEPAYGYDGENDDYTGQFVLIDEANYLQLNQHYWYLIEDPDSGVSYAGRDDEAGNVIYLHREVMRLAHDNPRQCEHKGLDPLDCRRSQLKYCRDYAAEALVEEEQEDHFRNYGNNTPKGWQWNRQLCKYFSTLMIQGKVMHLGTFDSPLAARRAWELAKMKYGLEAAAEKEALLKAAGGHIETMPPLPLERYDPNWVIPSDNRAAQEQIDTYHKGLKAKRPHNPFVDVGKDL